MYKKDSLPCILGERSNQKVNNFTYLVGGVSRNEQ